MAGKRELNKQKKYYDFIAAASRLFEEKGVENTKVQEIAAKVATGPKTLNRYFPTKNSLILALLIEDDAMSLKRAEVKAKKLTKHPVETVCELIAEYADYSTIIKHVSVWREYESVRMVEYNNPLNKDSSISLRLNIIDLIKDVIIQCRDGGKISCDVAVDDLTEMLHAIALLNYHKTLRGNYNSSDEALIALKRCINFAMKPYLLI
ncbi:AcrR family transcriptional regulator [Ochrobactrum anthropi]|uniref:TetR/AcrR family transcriptional regulator n=1 Tax=Brucella anthropi TaxID=529 RepID=UPI0015FA7580|nr:AcrR family transcriptional regulator [Brucella anthropi]